MNRSYNKLVRDKIPTVDRGKWEKIYFPYFR